MQKITALNRLRRTIQGWRDNDQRVALVPTMGALHDGHLALVKRVKRTSDRVVVSIFVNPKQFGAGEDLNRYPRDQAGDLRKLKSCEVDAVWMPDVATMYGDGYATDIVPAGAALGLEGDFRPEHFTGVATVCCKLFNQVAPDVAIFGEKDYQQLAVLRQLARDLDLPLKIIAGKTERERDGLALSSRNRYLSDHQRRIAPILYQILAGVAERARKAKRFSALESKAERDLISAGFDRVDYIAIRDADTLGPYDPDHNSHGRVLAAAWLGTTRLIDNCAI